MQVLHPHGSCIAPDASANLAAAAEVAYTTNGVRGLGGDISLDLLLGGVLGDVLRRQAGTR